MSLLRTRNSRHEERDAIWNGYPFPPSMYANYSNPSGISIDLRSALRHAASWACQRVLIATIAGMPVDVVRTVGKSRQPVDNPPRIVTNPSGKVSQRAWVAQNIRSLTSSGNIYGDVVAWDAAFIPTQIETVDPKNVSWRTEDGIEVPFVNGKQRNIYPNGDFWHVPSSQFLQPGTRVAMSPTEYAATAIGTSLAAENHGAQYFRDGAHPTQVAKVSKVIDPTEAQTIKDRINEIRQGNRETLVLGADIDLQKVQSDPKDSQFLDLLRFEIEQACRFWGVPPPMVYAAVSGEKITYANVNQEDLSFLKRSAQIWLVDLEDCWSVFIPRGQNVKLNVDSYLRMDAEARAAFYTAMLAADVFSVNYVRSLEDLEPWPDPIYDKPGLPAGVSDPLAPASAIPPVKVGPPDGKDPVA
jgi:HK97 family phage portal protein